MKLTRCYRGGDRNERPGWWLGFAYDEATVTRLKRIPHTDRSWDADTKLWWIASEHEDAIAALFGNFAAFRDQPVLL